jgi:hypothetical protein
MRVFFVTIRVMNIISTHLRVVGPRIFTHVHECMIHLYGFFCMDAQVYLAVWNDVAIFTRVQVCGHGYPHVGVHLRSDI